MPGIVRGNLPRENARDFNGCFPEQIVDMLDIDLSTKGTC